MLENILSITKKNPIPNIQCIDLLANFMVHTVIDKSIPTKNNDIPIKIFTKNINPIGVYNNFNIEIIPSNPITPLASVRISITNIKSIKPITTKQIVQ